ncbi:DUF429 domain-containing protein [Catellatospora sp. NPDC049111]|uniref:DUF429 domain-containing protein n=1 Tax=Catellatospora sp. NPDC049111 TaxID=3155271 RepID=UPI0033C2C31D
MTGRVLGVDACKAGWIGVVLNGDEVTAIFAPTITELVLQADADGTTQVVAIDIPIGLPDRGVRVADELARQAAGPRGASVFPTPTREALLAEDHATANALHREAGAKGISQQAYGLRAKIFDVDGWVRGQRRRVVEVHPELSFAAMAGTPLAESKTTWAGAERRRALLAAEGVLPVGDLGAAGRKAGVDDVLDAAAAAWSARRVLAGTALCRPEEPQVFSDGLPCAIWT